MKNIKITIKKELRTIVRDKKSLLMMALTPLFIPLFVFLMSFIYEQMINGEEKTYKIGINYELSDVEKEILKDTNLEAQTFPSIESAEKAYENKEILAYIIKEGTNYNIYNNSQSEEGSYINMFITNYLESYNNYLGQIFLNSNGIDTNLVYNNITYDIKELPGDSVMGNQIVNMAIVFTIMAMTLTAIYAATDSTAGEKERGTLETLLTYPIKAKELILGKYAAITISSIITLAISLILAIISLNLVKNNFETMQNIVFNFNFTAILLSIVILFIYALFISGLCIAIASFAKTFKEAQSSLTPVSLIICIPMFLEMLDVNLSGGLAFIPILNHNIVLNDIFLGNINIYTVIITIISSLIYTSILIYIIIREYRSEKILFDTN